MVIHLPALAWIAVGIFLLGLRSNAQGRFAYIIKSVEVFITGGLFVIAGGVFSGITIGMFEALGIAVPDIVFRLLFGGGGGLIPVLAVAIVYDTGRQPEEQAFSQGLSTFIATIMRLLLPLTLLVLVIYIFVIPFNFMQPFENREVLIVYNAMLFAIIGLLIGATPVAPDELSPALQKALRYGILAVAILAVLVSAYALSATAYRTVLGGMTINRLTVIGWNSINIALLALLIFRQIRGKIEAWVYNLKATFNLGAAVYLVWTIFLVLAIPLLFR
jgi:hypothetical protein